MSNHSIRVRHDGTMVTPATSVRNLGVVFDNELTMVQHVNAVTSSCFYQLRQLRFVRRSLSLETAKLFVHAFISSRIDYCNSIVYGASGHVTRKLQSVLHAAARLITGLRRFDHITPVLRDDLHWLPVEQRIEYKIALLVYKCLHAAGPQYLREHCTSLCVDTLYHHLRSVSRGDLHYPRTTTRRFGPRSFRLSGPVIWNSIPHNIRNSPTLSQFKQLLKHYLFCKGYNID